MNTEIIEVWKYSASLKIRPFLFGRSSIVLVCDFKYILECVTELVFFKKNLPLEASDFQVELEKLHKQI